MVNKGSLHAVNLPTLIPIFKKVPDNICLKRHGISYLTCQRAILSVKVTTTDIERNNKLSFFLTISEERENQAERFADCNSELELGSLLREFWQAIEFENFEIIYIYIFFNNMYMYTK